MKKEKDSNPVIATNHEARRDYFIDETCEAGIVLSGCEVKSLRAANASFRASFARLDEGELFLYNLYIAPYAMGGRENLEPLRKRKLLVHRAELEKLRDKTEIKNLVLVPLKLYFNKRGVAKVELGVGRGKKHFDKRADIKKASIQREIDRAIKNRNRK